MNEQIEVTEPIKERVILWQDHANRCGYRAELLLITFENGEKAFQLCSGGTCTRIKYVFPFLEKDRL